MTNDDGSAFDPRQTVALRLPAAPLADSETGGLSIRLLAAASLAAATRAQRQLLFRRLRLVRR